MTTPPSGRAAWPGEGDLPARVALAGMGVSGRAAQAVLDDLGVEVVALDERAAGARRPEPAALEGCGLVVASPGWHPDHPLFLAARARDIEVISEIELAWRLRARPTAPWLAVTGTNGKTTTTQLATAMLRASGIAAVAAGNIGDPLVAAVREESTEVFVVELSSYQLHFTTSMAPHAAVCLNVAPDHLDWHGGWEAYVAAKARVYERVTHACVFNADEPLTRAMVEEAEVAEGARAVGFRLGAPSVGELGVVDDLLLDRAFTPVRQREAAVMAARADLAHLGTAPHLIADALAAAALALSAGTRPETIPAALRGFRLDAHRIAPVAVPGAGSDAVRYIDDSKATNAHAAAASLAGMPDGAVVWIAGGLAKGATFDDLVIAARPKLRAVVLIGRDADVIEASLTRHASEVPRVRVGADLTGNVMLHAVAAARRLAQPGDVVLLAPACASMDQFESYAARGDAFVQAVHDVEG